MVLRRLRRAGQGPGLRRPWRRTGGVRAAALRQAARRAAAAARADAAVRHRGGVELVARRQRPRRAMAAATPLADPGLDLDAVSEVLAACDGRRRRPSAASVPRRSPPRSAPPTRRVLPSRPLATTSSTRSPSPSSKSRPATSSSSMSSSPAASPVDSPSLMAPAAPPHRRTWPERVAIAGTIAPRSSASSPPAVSPRLHGRAQP